MDLLPLIPTGLHVNLVTLVLTWASLVLVTLFHT